MRLRSLYVPVAAVLLATLIGCSGGSQSQSPPKAPPSPEKKDVEAEIRASLDKLSPQDRKRAEAQRYCAVENENRLGSMGVPMKVTLEGEPVFLCCDGCETRARAHVERTVAKARQLEKSGE